jgi:hypothetical protein
MDYNKKTFVTNLYRPNAFIDYVYGFWLFLLCCLVTPLVPYDSPFDTFWLPLWYLLITLWYLLLTHLVHCAYLFGTFWLPLWYLLPTLLVSSDHPLLPTAYPFGTFSLPLYFLRDTPFFLPTLLLPSCCYFGTFWLSFSLVPSVKHSNILTFTPDIIWVSKTT